MTEIRHIDREVRKALHDQVLVDHHRDCDTLVLDELGIRHGTCRVDIAVINGLMHGFEIKSDADTLDRLPLQMAVYREVFDRVTLVVGEKHAEKTKSDVPDWWGIHVATCDSGCIIFEETRATGTNTEINPVALAELLWRPEAIAILREMGTPETELRKPRAYLYSKIGECIEIDLLRNRVRNILKARTGWRGQRPPSSDDGL